MALQTILGKKLEQTQKFLEDGTRIPVTRILVAGNVVTNVKTMDKHNYSSIQLGFGIRKNATRAMVGNVKGASLEQAPKFLKEVRTDEVMDLGTVVNPVEVLAEGDIIDVTGVSKGKGYAGVVKRHGFHGGPKTHGQSDRHRAPGAIGQGTTPGRVYKGKRMAGRMGNENVTIKNLVVVAVTDDEVWVKGLIPGSLNSMVIVKKVGANKKFVPLFNEKSVEAEGSEQSVSGDAASSVETTVAKQAIEAKAEDQIEEKVEDNAVIDSPQNGQDDSSQNNEDNKEENKEEIKENAS